ncbi:hypothetical protein HYR99_39210 [Candidatus Poribacteria bacterium]|nr:hypothetical protein [Candidatus Poribacteria bacterium]
MATERNNITDSEEYQRDGLWQFAFETFYRCYYAELVASRLSKQWLIVDELARVMIALTAAGSAVSGWALWNNPQFKIVWSIIAGLGALLAILHSSLRIPERLKELNSTQQYFTRLRIDLETFRYRMKLNPNFSTEAFNQDFLELRKRYSEGAQRVLNDILLTKRLRKHVQLELDTLLRNEVTTEQRRS